MRPHESRDRRARLDELSKALRELIHDAEEDDLDEALSSAGESPQTAFEKGRLTAEAALARYLEIPPKSDTGRIHARRRDL